MDRRGAFDLLIGSVAKDGETLANCASIFIEHGFPLMPVATPARMPTPLHLIGSVAKHGETLAKCTSIFIEHGFPLMPVATPARMPTPLHAAAARGLHKLLNVLLAMDGAVELLQISGPNINVWDGVRVLTVTGTALAMAEAASTVSMNKSVAKAPKSVKPAN